MVNKIFLFVLRHSFYVCDFCPKLCVSPLASTSGSTVQNEQRHLGEVDE